MKELAYIKLDEQYGVKVHIAKNGIAQWFDAQITFSYDPDGYGNGYSMYVKSTEEPFGGQGYDLRYNKDFDPDYLIEFITMFYSRRFDGKATEYDTKWKLMGIHVYEAEFDEA